MSDTTPLSRALSRLAAQALEAPVASLSPDVRAALPDLVRALEAMNRLYFRQLGGRKLLEQAEKYRDQATDEAKAFWTYKGPWDRLDEDRPLLPGTQPPAPGKAVYPDDLSADEFEAYLKTCSAKQQAKLLDPCSVVVRNGDKLEAIDYTQAYADELMPAAQALREAASRIEHQGLKSYLLLKADALLGKKPLRDAEIAWVKLELPPLEVVVGPYEVYQDHLRGVKAFYEGMLLQVDPEACARLKSIEQGLGELAREIPCPANSRPAVGGMAPLIVADELLAAGDGHGGILASAFNLPNDPVVRGQVGWKQILIRNVMNAKFDVVARRIAERVFPKEQAAKLSFDAFFHHVLLHEVTHGLGPAYRADGRSINEACGSAHTPLEEAKADIGGLVLLLCFGGKFGIPKVAPDVLGVSYLAGLYRSARFGLNEAHGRANVIQYCFLKEQGALALEPSGRVQVVGDKLFAAARALLERLTLLQASGTPNELAEFLEKYGAPPEELVKRIGTLKDLPVDILPTWPKL